MPTITFPTEELEKLTGKKVENLDFSQIKAEATVSRNELKVELEDTNRPDLWSVEGIARHFRKRKEYVVEGKAGKIVAKSVPGIRPYIAASVVKGLKLDDEGIKSIMLAQEKLDEALGRDRKQTSIGLYRFDDLNLPLVYTTTDSDDSPFVPLGFRRIMTPAEILEEHPKGMKYGHIISGREFPIFKDSDDKVLSLPPIINSDDLGKIDENAKNILIEVTGTDKKMVSRVLTLITLCLADRGGKIFSVDTEYAGKKETYPDLKPRKIKINTKDMESLLGFKVDNPNKLLEKMHYKMISSSVLETPCYRWDIMHPVDVFEDVAIAYGFENIEPKELELPTHGGLDSKEILSDKARELLVGIPLAETIGMVMTNPTFQKDSMNLKSLDMIKLVNPMSESYSCLRPWLLPSLVEFLSKNTHKDYPQAIFEVGEVVEPANNYLGSETKLKVCCTVAKSDATFTDIKRVLETLFTTFGKKYSLKRVKHGSFIEGRSGSIIVSGKTVGLIGELHPEVLENWGIKVPISAFEIDLEVLG
jgi:phenylalanyl-tRNA synthetase beta chain